MEWGWRHLLWWGVLDEFNTLLDVALETLGASSEKLLLLLGDTLERVGSLLSTVRLYISLVKPRTTYFFGDR